MMQTLQHLGLDLAGEAHHDDFPVYEANPRGYYDIPFLELFSGIGMEYADKVVKLFGTSLPKIHYPQTITHAIVCMRRDTRAQDLSTRRVLDLEVAAGNMGGLRAIVLDRMKDLSIEDLAGQRRKSYKASFSYLEEFSIPYKKIYFEDMLFTPNKSIDTIIDFLGIIRNKKRVEAAMENIDYEAVSI
jgi:hypothetical protein